MNLSSVIAKAKRRIREIEGNSNKNTNKFFIFSEPQETYQDMSLCVILHKGESTQE